MEHVYIHLMIKNISTLKLLKTKNPSLKKLISRERIKNCSIAAGGGLKYNYSAKTVTEETVTLLAELCLEQELMQIYMAKLKQLEVLMQNKTFP